MTNHDKQRALAVLTELRRAVDMTPEARLAAYGTKGPAVMLDILEQLINK